MQTKTKLFISIFLIALGVGARLLPHAWNFTPIIAIGLFAGSYLGKRYAFTLPVITMILSDALIGFYDWKVNISVYVAFALSGVIGIYLSKRVNPVTLTFASITSSTLFFLVTNAAVWYFGKMYSPSIDGLFASLNAGIPFFRSALKGDLYYTFILFGSYKLATMYVPQLFRNTMQKCNQLFSSR